VATSGVCSAPWYSDESSGLVTAGSCRGYFAAERAADWYAKPSEASTLRSGRYDVTYWVVGTEGLPRVARHCAFGKQPESGRAVGALTLFRLNEVLDLRPLDELVADYLREHPVMIFRHAQASAAPKRGTDLLRVLSYERISGATMFPGPDGAVRALKERSRWTGHLTWQVHRTGALSRFCGRQRPLPPPNLPFTTRPVAVPSSPPPNGPSATNPPAASPRRPEFDDPVSPRDHHRMMLNHNERIPRSTSLPRRSSTARHRSMQPGRRLIQQYNVASCAQSPPIQPPVSVSAPPTGQRMRSLPEMNVPRPKSRKIRVAAQSADDGEELDSLLCRQRQDIPTDNDL